MRTPTSIGHRPEGHWTFDEEVCRVFEDMLRRSIPQYEAMRALVFEVGSRFVRPGTDVVDLGCSRGEALAPFVRAFGPAAHYVGIEVSAPMMETCRNRFARELEAGTVELLGLDLCSDFPAVEASLMLSVLTLQFTPVEQRQRILQDAYDRTVDGGALVLVEKVRGRSARSNDLLIDLYHSLKRANGYSQDEIDRKRLSLEGVLVPATADWNEDLLRRVGYANVECFWRCLNFSAWVAVKGDGPV